MTLYEYRCTNCGRVFEEDYPFGDAPEHTVCTQCAAVAYRTFNCFLHVDSFDPSKLDADKDFERGGGYEMYPDTPRDPRDHA